MREDAANEYVLGTDDDELDRLGFQHRLWSTEARALWQRAGFGPGQRLLDLGCGPGFATLELARLVEPHGSVIAIDAAARFIAHLEGELLSADIGHVETRVGDVEAMSLQPSSLDGAYTRWVLCFVARPEVVVRSVADALRPGGVFAVTDYFNQRAETVAPRHPVIDEVFEAFGMAWRQRGGDPDIGGRVPRLMADCGLEVREVRPNLRVGHPGSPEWVWIERTIAPHLDTLVELGLIDGAKRQAFDEQWARRRADPMSVFVSPPVFDVIGVKRG